jgi:hypothetical protein
MVLCDFFILIRYCKPVCDVVAEGTGQYREVQKTCAEVSGLLQGLGRAGLGWAGLRAELGWAGLG